MPTNQRLRWTSTLETEIAIAVPQKSPTAVRVATLELSALAEKYPLAFKGYELLTWQKDGEWVFTLLAGTNRQKSFDEILTAENTFTSTEIIKVSVIGADSFKELVNHLPKGEWITWGGMVLQGEVSPSTLYFTYPPDEIVDELIKYCKDTRHYPGDTERGIIMESMINPTITVDRSASSPGWQPSPGDHPGSWPEA